MTDQQIPATPAALKAVNPASFRDAAQCREWLARIAHGDPGRALEAVRDQLVLLLASDVRPDARVDILEALREPVAKLQATSASGYCGKEIPLAPNERDLWRVTADVRLAVAAAYEKSLADQRMHTQYTEQWEALVCQRALRELDLAIFEHARAYTAVPGEIWKRLHNLYRHSEARGITEMPATRSCTGVAGLPNCRSTYLHALLFDQAQPYSRTPTQIESVAGWLEKWAGLVSLHTDALGGNPLTALAIDLDSTDALKLLRHSQPGPGLRHVDTQRLGAKLKELSLALRKGIKAANAALATDLAKPVLERLLTDLYVQWCSAGTGRASARSVSSSKAMVTLTIPAMYFYISGRAFRQPGQGATRQEEDDLQVFGHISQRTTQTLVSQRSSAFESWIIANESTSGMLALCRQPDLRTRIAHGQLLGLMKRSDKPIELVTVQRLMLVETGELAVGVRRIDGIPQPVAVRIAATARPAAGMHMQSNDKYERALLLSAIPEKSLPPRLFLQPGWYQPQCSLDLFVSQKTSVRLLDLIEKGPNFEQVTFEPV